MTYPRQPLKHLAAVSVSNVDKKTFEGDHPVRLVNYTDVYYGDRITPSLPLMEATATAQQLEAFRLRPGDVAITKDSETADDIGIAALIEESAPDLVLGYHLALLRPRSSVINARFLYWCMRSDLARGQLSTGATGVTRFGLRQDVIASVSLPTPETVVQQAIADFLDTETARIDALIAKKRRMIDLLDERRRNFVAEAVTVGLGGASVVDTGHPFAPQIAAGWRLMRLRHVVREIVDTAHKTAPVVEGGEYLVVRTANVKAGRLVFEAAHFTDYVSWVEWTARGLPEPGDVIFTREAPAGEACLVPEGLPLCIGQRTVLFRPRRDLVTGAWLLHSLYSGPAQQFVEVLSRSTTVAHINMANIPDIPIVVPPMAQQERALQAIDRVTHHCEGVSRHLASQVELLQEHRRALITAAVTGELEVPGVAA